MDIIELITEWLAENWQTLGNVTLTIIVLICRLIPRKDKKRAEALEKIEALKKDIERRMNNE